MSKLSVIVPVYNVENYLRKCLDSIVAQTYNNLEIILVDDGSRDNSGLICDEYATRFENIKVIHKKNQGLGMARNSGLEIATGRYVAFVDSDDWIEPTMYETMINSLINSNSDVSTCGRKIVYDDGTIENIYTLESEEICLETNIIKEYLIQRKINMSACDKVFKRELFGDEIRFPEYYFSEDIWPIYQVLKKCKKIIMTGEPFYNYFVRKGSISRRIYNEKHEGFYLFSKKVADDVRINYPKLNSESDYYEFDSLISSYINFKDAKYNNQVLKNYRKTLLNNKDKILKNEYFNKKQKIYVITLLLRVDTIFSKIYKLFKR